MKVGTLFNESICIFHVGTEVGDFHPGHEQAIPRIWQTAYEAGMSITKIFAPTLKFTNRVAQIGADDVFEQSAAFFRTKINADGGIVHYFSRHDWGVMIANADCHVGIIFRPEENDFALLHLGLQCIFREDGSPSILKNAIAAMGNDAQKLQIWWGAGVGRCCNGYNHGDLKNLDRAKRIKKLFGNDVISGTVEFGPRRGQTAYDNSLMIQRSVEKLGFREYDCDPTCTSCFGLDDPNAPGYGTYFSNVRDSQKKGERNLFLARLALM